MRAKRLRRFDKSELEDLNKLLLQLSSRGYQMTSEHFKRILLDKNIYLLAVLRGRNIIGTATLVCLNQITGSKGYVEDIVVDEKYRGRGIGKRLMKKIIELAKKLKIFRLELKSETTRIAANKLYKNLGFKKIKANVYHLNL